MVGAGIFRPLSAQRIRRRSNVGGESIRKKINLMPVNRNALIRYRTIDHCLQNRRRKWTLEDLDRRLQPTLFIRVPGHQTPA
jgi:hypothetical protein